MKKKLIIFIIHLTLLIASIVCIVIFEINNIPIGPSIAGIVGGAILPILVNETIEMKDVTDWQMTLRQLTKSGKIQKSDYIRISFSYLFRIMVDGKYLLIQNSRNTGKFQPIGGVYKFHDDEREYLYDKIHAIDDNKIEIDESSKKDYRLRIPCKEIKRFVDRFDTIECNRERIDNVGREFREELIDDSILRRTDFSKISYRYLGRHVTDIFYDQHFRCYELMLFDIVELIPTDAQTKLLRDINDKKFLFASEEMIESLGIDNSNHERTEIIGDHTMFILQKYQQYLETNDLCKNYDVNL